MRAADFLEKVFNFLCTIAFHLDKFFNHLLKFIEVGGPNAVTTAGQLSSDPSIEQPVYPGSLYV